MALILNGHKIQIAILMESDRNVFGEEFMYLMGRVITLPIPTICAINGHCFWCRIHGSPITHDVKRLMREDRGFLCANEKCNLVYLYLNLNLLYFDTKVPANAFFETVQLSKRWTGNEAAILMLELFKKELVNWKNCRQRPFKKLKSWRH